MACPLSAVRRINQLAAAAQGDALVTLAGALAVAGLAHRGSSLQGWGCSGARSGSHTRSGLHRCRETARDQDKPARLCRATQAAVPASRGSLGFSKEHTV